MKNGTPEGQKPGSDKVAEGLERTNLGQETGTGTTSASAAAAPAKSEFQTWWAEITAPEAGRVLAPGIYDVQEPNEYFIDRLSNESLDSAKEFIGESTEFVVAMVPTEADDTYVILSQRPQTFEGDVHGHREGVLLLAECPDNVLIVAPAKSASTDQQ